MIIQPNPLRRFDKAIARFIFRFGTTVDDGCQRKAQVELFRFKVDRTVDFIGDIDH